MTRFALIALALLLELLAMATVFRYGGTGWTLLPFVLLHAGASISLSLACWQYLPPQFREPRWPTTLLLFNFAFFVPVVGVIGILLAVGLANWRRRDNTIEPFASVVLPEFVLSLRDPEVKYSQGGIRSRLTQQAIPTPIRLQSLLALQGMPARVSSPLLQDMLGDGSDDIRLVAYGLLDSREQKITAQIHRELVNLRSVESSELKFIGLRHLAELYWELIYAGLAQGDLRLHALNQALYYADEALKINEQDAGLKFLKGRILLELRRHEEAHVIFSAAIESGLPEARVLPYIVEIAFIRRDYATVQNLLARISKSQVTPLMKNAIQFWVHRAQPSAAQGDSV